MAIPKNSDCLPSLLTAKLHRESAERHAAVDPQDWDYQGGGMVGSVAVDLGWIPARWTRR